MFKFFVGLLCAVGVFASGFEDNIMELLKLEYKTGDIEGVKNILNDITENLRKLLQKYR